MVKWTTREYNMGELFTDYFSVNGGLGSCGELVFSFEDPNRANFLKYDVASKVLTVFSD